MQFTTGSFRFPATCSRCGLNPSSGTWPVEASRYQMHLVTSSHQARWTEVPVCGLCLRELRGLHLNFLARLFYKPPAFVRWSHKMQSLVFENANYQVIFDKLNGLSEKKAVDREILVEALKMAAALKILKGRGHKINREMVAPIRHSIDALRSRDADDLANSVESILQEYKIAG